MVNTGMQLISFTCAVTGWIMAIAVTALPQWKVSAFIGSNILTSEIKWEGIWMNCIYQTTGHMQCKTYDSMLALPPDIQAARALMCVAIFMGWLSCTVSCCGMKCTTCAGDDRRAKAGIALAGGLLFILTGLCVLIPCSLNNRFPLGYFLHYIYIYIYRFIQSCACTYFPSKNRSGDISPN
uniref:Claudin-4-like n=1 Tax=Scophthalmus maximus TaxID=52904 RepID=A0A8D2ZF80_SCOMX